MKVPNTHVFIYLLILNLCLISLDSAQPSLERSTLPGALVLRDVLDFDVYAEVFIGKNGAVHLQDDVIHDGVAQAAPVHANSLGDSVIQAGKMIAICGAYVYGPNWYVMGDGAQDKMHDNLIPTVSPFIIVTQVSQLVSRFAPPD